VLKKAKIAKEMLMKEVLRKVQVGIKAVTLFLRLLKRG
jgi:hypothetical protein